MSEAERAATLRRRYPAAAGCRHIVAGQPKPSDRVFVRVFNFGQQWRTPGMIEVAYHVEVPRAYVFDFLHEHVPDYIEDSRAHFDPDSDIDRALEAAGWPPVSQVLAMPELLHRFAEFYDHDLLVHWFGGTDADEQPGDMLNTVDSIDVSGAAAISFRGMARTAGMPVRYQDR